MNGDITYKLNQNSGAWSNVFRYNEEIRAALETEGQKLATRQQAATGEPQEAEIRVLRHTQVARIRPTSQRLSDEEAAERKRKAQHQGRRKYWRNQKSK